jgi:ArsR family transcriptional regulator
MSIMLPESENEIAELTAVLKALSEPNRLRIFAELMTGNSCNCELEERLGLPRNLLSHHLRVLSEAGLVLSRRDTVDGRWIYYSVDQDAVTQWQRCLTNFLDPARIQERPVCGPEGQIIPTDLVSIG